MSDYLAFTSKSGGLFSSLRTDVLILPETITDETVRDIKMMNGIWDTGATTFHYRQFRRSDPLSNLLMAVVSSAHKTDP